MYGGRGGVTSNVWRSGWGYIKCMEVGVGKHQMYGGRGGGTSNVWRSEWGTSINGGRGGGTSNVWLKY